MHNVHNFASSSLQGNTNIRFQDEGDPLLWKPYLSDNPYTVHQMLTTDEGRVRFWAESATETEDHIVFRFPNGQTWRAMVLDNQPPSGFILE